MDDLFKLHHTRLVRLCVRWMRGHRADAQDLLIEGYLRAVRATEAGPLPDDAFAWLSTIIANLARDQLRARSRATRSFDDDDDELELLSASPASDTWLMAREQLLATLDNVRELGPTQRSALLARSAGEEYEAIAAELDVSPANARKLVQTARSALRARLAAT